MTPKIFLKYIIGIFLILITTIIGIYFGYLATISGLDYLSIFIIIGIIIGIIIIEYVCINESIQREIRKNRRNELYERELRNYEKGKF